MITFNIIEIFQMLRIRLDAKRLCQGESAMDWKPLRDTLQMGTLRSITVENYVGSYGSYPLSYFRDGLF